MPMEKENLAFILVVGAGMSTCIGAAVVYNNKLITLASKKVLGGALGLSAGVMLYVSFVEIFQKSVAAFADAGYADSYAYLYATLCFFGGFAVMKLVDVLVHHFDPSHDEREQLDFDMMNTMAAHEAKREEALVTAEHSNDLGTDDVEASIELASQTDACHSETEILDKPLHHMGIMTALAIGIHNFPEGLATFVATLDDPAVGVALAVAIAIHNIPEGLCVSVPIYFATGHRHKAFLWGFISGLSEIVGAVLGWFVLSSVLGSMVYAVLFGLVAGMMVNICLYQLLPTARKYDTMDECVSNCTLAGMVIMAASLVMFLY